MNKSFPFTLVLLLFSGAACVHGAEPNLRYGAMSDTTETFTGTELIYIPVTDSSAPHVREVVELLRCAVVDAGLTLTDSAALAERMLTFELTPSSVISRTDPNDSSRTIDVTDSSFNSVRLYLFDIKRRLEGNNAPIWVGVLNATDDLFNVYIEQFMVTLLKLYGKNATYHEVIQPNGQP